MGSPSANSAGAEEAASNVNRKAILLVACIPTFFSVLNASAVVVLLPEIGAEFSVGSASLSWLMSGFLLVYGIAIPFFGRLAERGVFFCLASCCSRSVRCWRPWRRITNCYWAPAWCRRWVARRCRAWA